MADEVRAQQLFGAERFMKEPILFDAASRVIETWRTELRHEEQSEYRFADLPRGGLGSPVNDTGELLVHRTDSASDLCQACVWHFREHCAEIFTSSAIMVS